MTTLFGARDETGLEKQLLPFARDVLLAAVSEHRFACFSRSDSDSFSHLISWRILNGILNNTPLHAPRLRLYRNGHQIPPQQYTVTRRGGDSALLNSVALHAELSSGATLILDHIDELHEPIRTLIRLLENILNARIGANLYASFGTDNGFDLHWDNHDALILQVYGEKSWLVYPPTLAFPLKEGGPVPVIPTAPPCWNGVLPQGHALYIPRGYWHLVTPLAQPSLHLTIGIRPFNGADFLRWVIAESLNCSAVRQDLPALEDKQCLAAFLEALKANIVTNISMRSVQRFLTSADSAHTARPSVSLPPMLSGSKRNFLPPHAIVRLASPRPLVITHIENGNRVSVSSNAFSFIVNCSALPLLKELEEHPNGLRWAHLSRQEVGEYSDEEALDLVMALLQNGVVDVSCDS